LLRSLPLRSIVGNRSAALFLSPEKSLVRSQKELGSHALVLLISRGPLFLPLLVLVTLGVWTARCRFAYCFPHVFGRVLPTTFTCLFLDFFPFYFRVSTS
jgi:hypothetical protein